MTFGALLLAALTGSLHCGVMCGPFAAACGARGPSSVVGYQAGRLAGYLTLGALAGALGAGVDHVGMRLAGVQQVAGLVMGILLIFLAFRTWRARPALVTIGEPRRRNPLVKALKRADWRGATGVGALTAFLPCGWLWGFVAVAAASGSTLTGAAVLGALWLGGLPLLVAAGGLAERLRAKARPFARPAVALGLLLCAGLALTGHWLPQLAPTADPVAPDAQCHVP